MAIIFGKELEGNKGSIYMTLKKTQTRELRQRGKITGDGLLNQSSCPGSMFLTGLASQISHFSATKIQTLSTPAISPEKMSKPPPTPRAPVRNEDNANMKHKQMAHSRHVISTIFASEAKMECSLSLTLLFAFSISYHHDCYHCHHTNLA